MGKLYEGENITIHANQGERDAAVLAVLGDEALIEYEMPGGTTALRVVSAHDPDLILRRYAYTDVPLRWLRAMLEVGSDWTGMPQQSHSLAPSVRALYREKTGQDYKEEIP